MSNLVSMGKAERLLIEPFSTPPTIIGLIADDLARVEVMFRDQLASPVRIVDEIGGFVAESGGKRVRPTLHLLCTRMCGYEGEHQVALATVLEFIHSATLIHDDILDEAETRRGAPSANRRWGNNVSVLFGDYLFAKAMEMALQAGSLQVMKKLADVTLRMTEGEMLQTRYVGRLDLTTDEYLDLVERKTAALFGCCCELAGLLSGMDDDRLVALRRYGTDLGMAFQLVDDLLDFTGEAERMGKPVASDLSEGKATLAVLDLLSQGQPEVRDVAQRIVDGLPAEAPEFARFTDWLRERGAIERTHARARRFAASALDQLRGFPEGPAKDALTALPDMLLFRDR
ncbi:MAG: polyprenyl synthetase family protein [Acidobacteriota bacterium]|nr:polyprenyl synthetase family protein [Acidobacteriota bacterium]MDH3785499.1 polyprenyl synthetase family protein [Acidobacteriota bacterium]